MSEPNDDAALVAQAKADPQAFGALYERYVHRVYNYIYYRIGNTHEAEDLTARVFQRAMAHLPGFTPRPNVPFVAWLYRIAHNLVANWHRDQQKRPLISLTEVPFADWRALHAEAPELALETQEERERLLRAFRRLPADRQQLIVLKLVDQLSNTEIGAIMERSEGSVKSLYHRTLLALRADLTQTTEPSVAPDQILLRNPS